MRIALAPLLALLFLPACGEVVNPFEDGAREEREAGDPCVQKRARNACGDAGAQYCDDFEGSLEWGPCIDPPECRPGDVESCGEGERQCRLYGAVPGWDESECWSADPGDVTPLVLQLGGAPIEMVPVSATTFDLAGRDSCRTLDWPTADTPWLAMDLDGNGAIEDGRELFGSGTILPGGRRAKNGFAALRLHDSNGDGVISPADEAWPKLLAWADHDQDRVGTLDELMPVEDLGLTEIALDFMVRPECDNRGNCGLERATFASAQGPGAVVDLHLACQ